jgi:hypothetical protein
MHSSDSLAAVRTPQERETGNDLDTNWYVFRLGAVPGKLHADLGEGQSLRRIEEDARTCVLRQRSRLII